MKNGCPLCLKAASPPRGTISCAAGRRTKSLRVRSSSPKGIWSGTQLHNKGVAVALFDRAVTLTDSFAGAVTDENRPEGYVDVLAVQGNDAEDAQVPPVYEGAYEDIQSKKRRCAA